MKRPYSAHAYSMGPIRRCYWAEAVTGEDLHAPAAEGALSADIAVIGGGYTGLNAALALAEAGEEVTLLDAEFPGWGASGRNGGFCCLGGARAADSVLDRLHGAGASAEVHRAEVASVAHVGALLERLGIDADRHSEGETVLAHSPQKMASLRAEKARLERTYGVTCTLVEREDLPAHGMTGPHYGALTLPIGFALHPRKYLAGLVGAAARAGVRMFGDSPVMAIERAGEGWALITPEARLTCRRLVLATNGYSAENVPAWMRHRFLPAQSSVIATRPMTQDELAAQGWTSHQMSYENRRLLHYFHLTPDNCMVFGQRGGLISTPGNEERIARRVRADFNAMFPAWEPVDSPFYWSGMVCLTAALRPFCGPVPEMPGVFAAFGYHGNGVAMGSYCGALLAALVRGEEPEGPYPRAFAAPLKRFPLGPVRRAWLAAEYSWTRLTER
ncbi:FAD-dependent oxidoreductase [Pseudooceanicola sp. 216_PA32_1]|uniref:FAD-dependent oxidoreductase n=1 Tax=Pseudooceanicola pacificus TaxID=2676438 RepID=A0A844WCQ6_9RHOB|nr:FAD-dependent oxidoreductase [Pseudooceanicola pacificus]MWB76479.1 FAD-dependent oxidoreductase [Pseudooceanicola pacificus]